MTCNQCGQNKPVDQFYPIHQRRGHKRSEDLIESEPLSHMESCCECVDKAIANVVATAIKAGEAYAEYQLALLKNARTTQS
jgi:hypothetical protein